MAINSSNNSTRPQEMETNPHKTACGCPCGGINEQKRQHMQFLHPMECIRQADDSKSGVQELCESQSGLPGLPVPSSPYGLCGRKATLNYFRAQELCESRGGRPGLPVPNSPYGLCGQKTTLNYLKTQQLCESPGGRPGLPGPNSPYGVCGRKATLKSNP